MTLAPLLIRNHSLPPKGPKTFEVTSQSLAQAGRGSDRKTERDPDAAPRSTEDYLRFRPAFHVQPPVGWINDPCAPGYDPATGFYHLFYQWNPKSSEWADIAWGQVVSADLVHWRLPGPGKAEPVLVPSSSYDLEGVFSGCMWPRGLKGEDGALSIIYTSVSALPIHYSRPYLRGSETLSIATSHDGGRTWFRIPNNPILPGPPAHLDVRGWRDPYVAQWPALSKLLDLPCDTLFGLISGSLVPHHPTTFLYSISPSDLTNWTFLSPLVHIDTPLPPTRWTGDIGKNWEVCNFLQSLRSEVDAKRAWIIAGSEGAKRWDLDETGPEGGRTPRWSLWVAGTLKRDERTTEPRLQYSYSGVLDHGMYYAANSFHDSVKDRCIVWGWLLEDDLPPAQRAAQAWAGVISLPRELTVVRIPHVVAALRTPLREIGCVSMTPEGDGEVYTVETLGISPLEELALLRERALQRSWERIVLTQERSKIELPSPGRFWDFEAVVTFDEEACTEVGIIMRHTGDLCQHTTLIFSPWLEEISVSGTFGERLSGPHTLFTFASGEKEPLILRVLCDNSVIEVYANARFAMSARCYPLENSGRHGEASGLTIFASGKGGKDLAVFERVGLWSNLAL